MNRYYLEEIILTFGEPNDYIDDNDLECIFEELQTINNSKDIFDLTKTSILLGKPDILKFLLDNNDFAKKQIEIFEKTVETYVRNQQHNKNTDDMDNILEIIKQFEKIISSYHHSKRKWDKN